MSYNSKRTGAEVNALLDKAGTALQEHQDISGLATKAELNGKQDTISDLATIRSGAGKGATAVQPSSLATVATSGSYNDLSDKPTIPAAVTESTVSGWGFTKNTGTYSKPSAGIPKSDLASAVQTSLGKADTALQSYTEQYTGTVTGVKINGSTKNPSNGVVDLGTVLTEHQSLKTINGQSILGSGDITISGGGEEEYAEPYLVDYGGGGMGACFAVEDDINSPMLPDVTYICPVAVMVVWVQTLQPPTGNVGKYTFHFKVGSDGAMVYIDESILMAGERPETLEPNVAGELSIVATKIGNSYVYKGVLAIFS